MRHVVYDTLTVNSVPKIVAVHRRGFSSEQLERTIFCSSRIERYLTDLMTLEHIGSGHRFVGAWLSDKLIGYAHFRPLPGSWHLNQVVILPQFRSRGIGRKFMDIWIQTAREANAHTLSLDVEGENVKAFDWYQRLGLVPEARTHTFQSVSLDLAARHLCDQGEVLDWDQTLAWKTRYGFGTIRIRRKGNLFNIGWLCDALRVDRSVPFEVLGKALDVAPGVRRVLMTSPEHISSMGTSWDLIGTSIRMTAPIALFAER